MQDLRTGVSLEVCNILTNIGSVNAWASGDSPLAQLVKELDLCLFLCVIRSLINNLSPTTAVYTFWKDNNNIIAVALWPLDGKLVLDF